MMNLMDRIARSFGYATPSEVTAYVRDAEKRAGAFRSDKANSDIGPTASVSIPADYIRYFVSYNFSAGHGCGGFGCIEIGRRQTIRGQSDITMIVNLIEDTLTGRGFQNPGVVILNWQPFEPPRQEDGGRETAEDDMPSTVVLRLVA